MTPLVSIIICTCNRADDLRQTLDALEQVHVPDDLPTEVVVVDNGSTDSTAQVVQSCRLSRLAVRSLDEPKRGKGHAYNAGLAAARGRALLLTDDDVRPPPNWIEGMCRPILNGQAHAVAGGVEMARELRRPWMTTLHRTLLACTDDLDPADPAAMIGANMAFASAVLEKVPRFDTALGPGGLGFEDEILFSLQLKEAGYRFVSAFDVVNEHHFDPSRLLRASFLDSARKSGRSTAYVAYHWEHRRMGLPPLQIARRLLRLAQWRVSRQREIMAEGIPEWEFWLLRDLAFQRQLLIERKGPRLYDRRGLVKHGKGKE